VEFGTAFLTETAALAAEVRAMLDSGVTPPPRAGGGCDSCSLEAVCLPRAHGRSVRRYWARVTSDAE
jgi:CRISPR-associated exonuclease Cas4